MKCEYCDEYGFCNKYPGEETVYMCRGNCKELLKESPCLTCNMVKYPHLCENKGCVAWRRWFIEWWEEMRRCNNGK